MPVLLIFRFKIENLEVIYPFEEITAEQEEFMKSIKHLLESPALLFQYYCC